MLVGGVVGNKGEKKWDNYNSIINKIYFFKKESLKKNSLMLNTASHNNATCCMTQMGS